VKIGVETGKWCFNRVFLCGNQWILWDVLEYIPPIWLNKWWILWPKKPGDESLEPPHLNGGWTSINPSNLAPGWHQVLTHPQWAFLGWVILITTVKNPRLGDMASSMRKLHICPQKIAIVDYPHWVHEKCISIRMALWQLWENMENCPNLEWKVIPIIPRKESFMVFNNKILILDTQIAILNILGSSILPSHISFLLDWLVHKPSWIKSIENPRFCVMYMYTLW